MGGVQSYTRVYALLDSNMKSQKNAFFAVVSSLNLYYTCIPFFVETKSFGCYFSKFENLRFLQLFLLSSKHLSLWHFQHTPPCSARVLLLTAICDCKAVFCHPQGGQGAYVLPAARPRTPPHATPVTNIHSICIWIPRKAGHRSPEGVADGMAVEGPPRGVSVAARAYPGRVYVYIHGALMAGLVSPIGVARVGQEDGARFVCRSQQQLECRGGAGWSPCSVARRRPCRGLKAEPAQLSEAAAANPSDGAQPGLGQTANMQTHRCSTLLPRSSSPLRHCQRPRRNFV